MQFSYILNDKYIFLDPDTYEEFEISKDKLENIIKYLKESMLVEFMFDEEEEILGVTIPDKICLKIIQTDSLTTSNNARKTTSFKDAVLETGLIIKVPIFIEQGEEIIINTETGLYISRK